jgi:hypothetical protein
VAHLEKLLETGSDGKYLDTFNPQKWPLKDVIDILQQMRDGCQAADT